MLAELVFFQNLLRRRIPPIQTPSPTPAGTWRWMDSFPAAKGWSGGSVVFSVLSLLSIVSWTIGDFAGSYLFGEGYGNAWMSLGSLLVNASILSGIILCLSASASDGNGWKGDNDDDESKAYAEWYSQYFQSFMLLLLGSSGAKAKSNGAEQQWQGRLLFLQDKMSSFAAETRNECDARMRSIESRIEESEARIRGEISAMELRWQSRQDANERLDDAVSQLLHLMRHHGHGLRNVGD